jgi:hypothetical protein
MSKGMLGEFKMTKKNTIIPFFLHPVSWGLKGKTRLRAKAEYEYSGYDLDLRIAVLESENDIEYQLKKLDIQRQYDHISQYDYELQKNELIADNKTELARLNAETEFKHNNISEYDYRLAKLPGETDSVEWQLAKLELDLEFKLITDYEMEKQAAELRHEPWVSMPKINWDPVDDKKNFFELDYNDYFLEFLKANGYNGTEEEVINHWLNDICRLVSNELNIPENTFVANGQSQRISGDLTEYF